MEFRQPLDTWTDALCAARMLRELAPEHLEHFARLVREERQFVPGMFLFHQRDSANEIYVVRSGKVALEVFVEGRGTMHVETIVAGDVLGWSALAAPYLWHADALVVEPTSVCVLDAPALRSEIEKDPSFGRAVTKAFLNDVHYRLERVRAERARTGN